ncbi:hypothetical protein [Psychroserpens luteus]|uniref:Lipoprotein n=1 Tax=Psychroserpens luteus TaxID=1434066 RepID=A0ABW5ZTD2_9FLAO|nr:hypothetical protein [Psychroserpens luteus]
MKKIILIIVLGILCLSCSINKNAFVGTYYNSNDVYIGALKFDNSGHYYLLSYDIPTSKIDTLSNGSYKLDNGFLNLSSEIDKYDNEFDTKLFESYNPDISGVKIEIVSPLISELKEKGLDSSLFFVISGYSNNNFLENSTSNVFELNDVKAESIEEFYVFARIGFMNFLDKRKQLEITTKTLAISNLKNNNFRVEIPKMTNSELRKTILRNHYLKVIDKNQIQWADKVLVKIEHWADK